MKPQVYLFSFVFWRKLKTPKRHFKINWPLRTTKIIVVLGISHPKLFTNFNFGKYGKDLSEFISKKYFDTSPNMPTQIFEKSYFNLGMLKKYFSKTKWSKIILKNFRRLWIFLAVWMPIVGWASNTFHTNMQLNQKLMA